MEVLYNVRDYYTTDNKFQPEAPTDLEVGDFKMQ